MNEQNDGIQMANALAKANEAVKAGSTNKPVYKIVVVDDFFIDKTQSFYAYSGFVDTTNSNYLTFKGYQEININSDGEVKEVKIKEVKTFVELMKCVDENNLEEMSLMVPWHKVIRITNVSHVNQAKKGNK